MPRLADQLTSLAPALAFLLAGVPLAALLDRLGFFDAVAEVVAGRDGRDTPVLALWALAALTTIVLNLDTTVVLLTPLYLRLARRADADPLPLALIPLLLASFASSVLPVSNLTTLIVVDRLDLGVGEVVGHLALPSISAIVVGWWAYRHRYPTRLAIRPAAPPDRRALGLGCTVVAALLVAFVVGPTFGLEPWMAAVLADLVLMAITGLVPWRDVPVTTAIAVAAVAAACALVVPDDVLGSALATPRPIGVGALALGAATAANVVNNLPALLIALNGAHRATWGLWAWLLGVNTAAVLLPIGALANLLWLRVLRRAGLSFGVRRYVATTAPIAVPALAASIGVLLIERLIVG